MRLSNSFNGLPGKRQGLNGWEASVGFPEKRGLRFLVDYVSFDGTNEGASQKGTFAMAGAQYERHIGREGIFVEGLAGEANLKKDWYHNGGLATTASLTEFLGGGVDTPLSRSFAFRVTGGVQHTNFALLTSKRATFPYYRPAGLPDNFARLTAGLVWTHQRAAAEQRAIERRAGLPSPRKDTQLTFLAARSVGHYRFFGGTNRSILHVAGLEYDRDLGIRFLASEVYYSADIMPAVILQQPKKTDAYGDNLSPGQQIAVPGVAIAPVGVRFSWLNRHAVSPFFQLKAGMVFFTQKALSPDASYEDFTAHEALGVQFRITHRWGFRINAGDLHISNAFAVPSDPGLDSMMIEIGVTRDIGKRRWFL